MEQLLVAALLADQLKVVESPVFIVDGEAVKLSMEQFAGLTLTVALPLQEFPM